MDLWTPLYVVVSIWFKLVTVDIHFCEWKNDTGPVRHFKTSVKAQFKAIVWHLEKYTSNISFAKSYPHLSSLKLTNCPVLSCLFNPDKLSKASRLNYSLVFTLQNMGVTALVSPWSAVINILRSELPCLKHHRRTITQTNFTNGGGGGLTPVFCEVKSCFCWLLKRA